MEFFQEFTAMHIAGIVLGIAFVVFIIKRTRSKKRTSPPTSGGTGGGGLPPKDRDISKDIR